MNLGRRVALAGFAALAATRAEAAGNEAAAPIEALGTALIAAMKAGKLVPFGERFAELSPAVQRAFDLPAILKASVGPRWASLSPAEQQSLLAAFRRFTIASYVANFANYDGERIDIAAETRSIGPDLVVGSRLVSGGETTPIDYVMHKSDDGWRAIDVLLNGSISQVAVNRSDWRSLLVSGAGPLTDSLERRTATLSGGALN